MGVVVDSVTAKPVPSAVISIGSAKVMSDDEGRFVFTDLSKGVYAIDAAKPGYFDGAYGRQRPEGPSATLALGADERIGSVRIALFKFGAISGQVRDEAGEPVVGAEVDVLSKSWLGGRQVLARAASAVTDDRGAYRADGLGAGEFVVAAIFRTLPIIRPEGDFVYAVHYFPGATLVEQASAISIKVGDDRTDVDIPLQLSAAAKVYGIVRSPNGPVAAPVVLTASAEGLGAGAGVELEAAEEMSEPNGRFMFKAVPAGSYVARALVQPPPVKVGNALTPQRLMWATAPVVVNGDDVTNVEVLLRPGFKMIGSVVFDAAPRDRQPRYDVLRRLTVTIDSLDVDMRTLGDAATMTVDAAGFFTSKELPPGRYFVRLDNPPPGWSLRKVGLRGRDLSNAPVALDADVTGLTLTFTERPTELSGLVRSDSGAIEGATVLVFPRDRTTWTDFGRRPLGLRAARSSRDGSFRFGGLPPGDYFVIAVDDAASVDWQQARRLELLAQSATSISLADAERRVVDLRTMVIR